MALLGRCHLHLPVLRGGVRPSQGHGRPKKTAGESGLSPEGTCLTVGRGGRDLPPPFPRC